MSAISNIAAKQWARTIGDIQRRLYWVIGLIMLFASSYIYYTVLDRPVAGVLWFIGGFLILYFFWLKWFVLEQPMDADLYFGTNACPDYLSPLPNNSGLYAPTSKTQYFCVDFVGVSRNGGIRQTSHKTVQSDINNPAYRFSVDPLVDFTSAAGKAAFLQRLESAGLSYNIVGDSSLPKMNSMSNGAPVFSDRNMSGNILGALMGAAASSAGSVNQENTYYRQQAASDPNSKLFVDTNGLAVGYLLSNGQGMCGGQDTPATTAAIQQCNAATLAAMRASGPTMPGMR